MGWFSHKNEEKRNFGDIPRLPDPPSDLNFKFSGRPDSNRADFKSGLLKNPMLPDIDEKNLLEIPRENELPSLPETISRQEYLRPQINQPKEQEQIFVRLDNFQATLKSFEEIKRKVNEIEHLLAKTRELKEKEQKEIEEWEHELRALKARLDSIDKTLFSKLE